MGTAGSSISRTLPSFRVLEETFFWEFKPPSVPILTRVFCSHGKYLFPVPICQLCWWLSSCFNESALFGACVYYQQSLVNTKAAHHFLHYNFPQYLTPSPDLFSWLVCFLLLWVHCVDDILIIYQILITEFLFWGVNGILPVWIKNRYEFRFKSRYRLSLSYIELLNLK